MTIVQEMRLEKAMHKVEQSLRQTFNTTLTMGLTTSARPKGARRELD